MMKQTPLNRFYENKKSSVVVFAVVIAVIIGAVILFSDYGIVKLINLEVQISELEEEIHLQNKIRDSLNYEIKSLLKDTSEIERMARDKYGLIKPGEEIIIIKKKQNN